MYEYELQRIRSAELLRRAEQERLAREAVRVRRAARRSAEGEGETGAHASGRRGHPRAA